MSPLDLLRTLLHVFVSHIESIAVEHTHTLGSRCRLRSLLTSTSMPFSGPVSKFSLEMPVYVSPDYHTCHHWSTWLGTSSTVASAHTSHKVMRTTQQILHYGGLKEARPALERSCSRFTLLLESAQPVDTHLLGRNAYNTLQ